MRELFPPRNARENVIPLINVVFLLLIFFMITGHISNADPILINPPFSKIEAGDVTAEKLLVVSEKGEIYFGDDKVRLTDFPHVLKSHKDQILTVKIDQNCTRDCFMPVLKKLSETGFKKISLMTLQAP